MSSLMPWVQESSPHRLSGSIAVIVIVLVLWPPAAELVGVYVNAVALIAALAGGGTAVMYRNHRNPR